MGLAHDQDMVQAFSPDRADEPFDVSILPGRARRGWSVADTHRPDPLSDDDAVGAISIADQVAGRLVPREALGDLAGDPFRGWVGGDGGPDQTASLKRDDRQAIEQLEADGPYNEQIYGGDVRGVIADKGLSSLCRWPPAP